MNIVKAGAEGLIWVVVGIFWVIAQIAGAAAQKKRITQQPPADDEERELPVDPITELLRKMTGVQEFELPHPGEREEPEFIEAAQAAPQWETAPGHGGMGPAPVRMIAPSLAWKVGDVEALPDLSRRSETKADIQPLRREPAPPIEAFSKIEEVDIRPTMRAFRNTLPAMRLPSMKLHFQCATHHDRDVDSGKVIGRADRLDLQSPKTLRRAMLSHIIFSPPKALQRQGVDEK